MNTSENENPALEEMSAFFTARVNKYDVVHTGHIDGKEKSYIEVANLIPAATEKLMDLGCGTGVELEWIFKRLPGIKVTGIDLCPAMLDKLRSKFPNNNNIILINADFFNYDLGMDTFDTCISLMSLHHFSYEGKIGLYKKVYRALTQGGIYIECDYMVPEQRYEDEFYTENRRLRAKMGITEGYYHYDTPCTVANQIKMLINAGFSNIEEVWRIGNTVILEGKK